MIFTPTKTWMIEVLTKNKISIEVEEDYLVRAKKENEIIFEEKIDVSKIIIPSFFKENDHVKAFLTNRCVRYLFKRLWEEKIIKFEL